MKQLVIAFVACIFAVATSSCNGITDDKTNGSVEQTETIETKIPADTARVADTVDLDAYLNMMDDYTAILKDIHIKTIADTVLLSESEEQVKALNEQLKSAHLPDFNPDEMTHSEKVRVCQSLLFFSTEFLRINEELRTVGVPTQSNLRLDDEDEEMMTLFVVRLKRELEKELN